MNTLNEPRMREEVQQELTVTLLAMIELVRQHPQPHSSPQTIHAWKRSLPPGRWLEWTALRAALEELLPQLEQEQVRISQTDADWLYWTALLLPVGVIARAAGVSQIEFSQRIKPGFLTRKCEKCGTDRPVRNRAEYKRESVHSLCGPCRIPATPTRSLLPLEQAALDWLLAHNHDSPFLQSLQRQAKDWLAVPVKRREAPLSPRQFQCLFESFHAWRMSEEFVEEQRRKMQPSLN